MSDRKRPKVPEHYKEVRVFFPPELLKFYKRLARLRRQSLNEVFLISLAEHPHCMDDEGTLLPYDFDDTP